jgi:hypothetical protein
MFLIGSLFLTACGSPVYLGGAIEARVVDGETGLPIEGAIVVANWQLVRGSFDGEHPAGQLKVRETVTDQHGNFSFGWFVGFNPLLAELRDRDPQIVIFKAGYQYAKVVNDYPRGGSQTPGFRRTSSADGQTIKLHRGADVKVGRFQTFYRGLNVELQNIIEDCDWDDMPRMLRAMDAEKKRLHSLGMPVIDHLIGADDVDSHTRPWCRVPPKLFEGVTP